MAQLAYPNAFLFDVQIGMINPIYRMKVLVLCSAMLYILHCIVIRDRYIYSYDFL